MGKGVLLEMGGREAVVLTPQGEFKKVPVPKGSWEIGDEIEFAEAPERSFWAKWGLTAAAAAIILLAPISWAAYQQIGLTMPVAVISMDINPSIELTVNKADDVLTAKGLNADGEKALQGLDVRRHPLDQVVREITDRAVELNKLDPADPTSAVLLAVAPTDGKELAADKAEALAEKAKQAVAGEVQQVAQHKGVQAQTAVAGLVATAAEKQAAEQAGVSVGKLKLYEEIKQIAPTVNVEDLKTQGPGKLLKSLNLNPSEVFSQAEQKHSNAPGQNKPKGKAGGESPAPQSVVPASGKPADNGKQENPGADKREEKQEPKDAKSGAPADDKKNGAAPAQNDSKGQERKDTKQAEPEKKSESEKKSEPKKNDQGNSNGNGNAKGKAKRDSWTIPFFNITIDKPAFLKGKSEADSSAQTEASTPPRADEPGAVAPAAGGAQADQAGQPAAAQDKQDQKDQKDQGQKDKEQKSQDQQDKEQKDKEQKDKEKEQKEKEQKEKEQKEKEDKGKKGGG